MSHVPTLEHAHELVHTIESVQHSLENFRRTNQYAPRISVVLGELDILRKALEQQNGIAARTGRAPLELPQLAVVGDVVRSCSEWLRRQNDAVANHHAQDAAQVDEELRSIQTWIRTISLRLKNVNVASVLHLAFAIGIDAGTDKDLLAASLRGLRRIWNVYDQINQGPPAALSSRETKELGEECQIYVKQLTRHLGLSEHSATQYSISQLVSQCSSVYSSAATSLQQPISAAEFDGGSKHREAFRRGDASISLDKKQRPAAGFIMFPNRCCWFAGEDSFGEHCSIFLEQCFTKPGAQRFAWRHLYLHKTLTVAFMKQDRPEFELISYEEPQGSISQDCVLEYIFSGHSNFYKTFHNDLHQKYLLDEFETGYITLNGGEKLRDNYIKLWRDEQGGTTVTLPLRYQDGDIRHMELAASQTTCKSQGTDVAVLEIPRPRQNSIGEVPEETAESPSRRKAWAKKISLTRRNDNGRQQMVDNVHIEFKESKNEHVTLSEGASAPANPRDRFIGRFVSQARSPSPPVLNLPSPASTASPSSHFSASSGTTIGSPSIWTPMPSSTDTRNTTSTRASTAPSLELPPPTVRPSQPLGAENDVRTQPSTIQEPAVASISDYWKPGAWLASSRAGAFFRDTTGSTFVYQPLQQENEIRLLCIEQIDNGVISCHVEHHNLGEAPSFEALSYCWGDNTERRDIQIGDNIFEISLHLWNGLRRLLLQDDSRLLWIDAICINQGDISEKNHQIVLMQHIYKRAHRTIIWLGEFKELGLDSPTCKRRYRSSEESDDAPNTLCCRQGTTSSALHINGNLIQKLKDILHPLHDYLEQNGLADFWWKRLWCIQEYHFSALRPSVYIGPHAISFHHFFEVFDDVEEVDSPLHLFSTLRTPEHHRLYDLISDTGSFQCGDPRDRIYSLLGMAEEASTKITPDYGSSALRIYEQACQYLIRESDTLDVLIDGRVDRSKWGRYQQKGIMPTWMPDFTSLRSLHNANQLNNYSCSSEPLDFRVDKRRGIVTPGIADYDLPLALSIKAVKFDKIDKRTTEDDVPEYEQSPQGHLIYNSRQSRGRLLEQILEKLEWEVHIDTPHELQSPPCIGFLMLDYLFEDKRSVVQEVERRAREPERDLAETYRRQRQQDISHAQHFEAEQDIEYVRDRWRAKIDHAEQGVVYEPKRLRDALAAAKASGDSRVETDFHIARDFENLFAYARKTTGRYYFTADNYDAPMRTDVLLKPTVKAVRRLSTQFDIQETPEFHEYSAKSRKRDFFRTSSGFLGLGPETLQENDIIVMPFGASRPFILRESSGLGEYYQFIGEAMIPILMLEDTWPEQQKGSAHYYNIV